jgi:hypothetical protein
VGSTPDPFQFSSECPNCGQERLQTGLPREEVVQLLRAGAELEAYCASCDETWSVSVEERADLARALERKKK